jgi:hypothetical protein
VEAWKLRVRRTPFLACKSARSIRLPRWRRHHRITPPKAMTHSQLAAISE